MEISEADGERHLLMNAHPWQMQFYAQLIIDALSMVFR